MPLFNYKCQGCEFIVEKFLHHRDDEVEIECPECGGEGFDQIIGNVQNRVWLNATENLHSRILPDADRIQEKICNGSDSDFLDIVGD